MIERETLKAGFARAHVRCASFDCMKETTEFGVLKHVLATQNIERIEIGEPKQILTEQNIYHNIIMMQKIHHDQLSKLKQFYVQW